MKFDNLLYYSTNTYLAFIINQNFYNKKHYVWCSPIFDSQSLGEYDIRKRIPPSSNPSKIYISLKEDIRLNDLHSSKIEQNKRGIKAGAAHMLRNNVITEHEFGLITKMVDSSSPSDYRPLVYLIPKEFVEDKIELVDVDSRANPLSVEYRIFNLEECEFEIIEF